MDRTQKLAYLRENPEIPVLIVGAGINGASTFRELAMNDVNVVMVERGDYSSGASAASSHMAHGGIRYLENGEFRLVQEALLERNRLLRNAPHLCKPLPTTIPMYKWFSGLFNAPFKFLGLLSSPSERGFLVIRIGLILYDFYARRLRVMPKHAIDNRKQSLEKYPGLNPDVLYTATYYDGYLPHPERLAMELIFDGEAAYEGAKAINYLEFAGGDGDSVTLRDVVSGDTVTVRPQVVVNAAGPWIDIAHHRIGQKTSFIGGTKGSHLVVDHPRLRATIGDHEFFFENEDGRIVLILPFFDKVMIGTTDIFIEDPDQAVCTDDEIEYILKLIPRVFPDMNVSRDDIVFTFSGVRPLPASDAKSAGQVSRDHSIKKVEAGTAGVDYPVLSLVGGKWTSFRAFGEEVADEVMGRLGLKRTVDTLETPIGGGRDYPVGDAARTAWIAEVADEYDLSEDRVTDLFMRYGTVARDMARHITMDTDAPLAAMPSYSRREIAYLARAESVVHVEDILLRRTLLSFLGHSSPDLIADIADVVGEALGWTADRRQAEIARAAAILSEQFRTPLAG